MRRANIDALSVKMRRAERDEARRHVVPRGGKRILADRGARKVAGATSGAPAARSRLLAST
jgi:hypothetical protein